MVRNAKAFLKCKDVPKKCYDNFSEDLATLIFRIILCKD